MGRLFWKFFLFIWLAQLAGILGTGTLFWMERQSFAVQHPVDQRSPPPGEGPREFQAHPPAPGFSSGMPPPPPHGRPPGGPFPVLPLLVGLLASLLCAAGLAWYFAKPIRHLRDAFAAAAKGDLDVRVTPEMAGRRDELADLGRGFDHMTAQLQGMIEGQKRLLHDVSHEMRSPLARLQAAIGLARQQPARMEDTLQRIEREGERINQLLGGLLTLSRLEAGVAGKMEIVEMGELLTAIVEDARFEGASRRIRIDFLPGEMAEVRASPELLRRAIENVLRNALRHSPDGGMVTLVAGLAGPGRFCISIADQGPGVAEADLESIFTPFFRSEETSGAGGGYGLGLAIARRAITVANGEIHAKRGKPGGLVVEMELRV